jgi:hypothetical protein
VARVRASTPARASAWAAGGRAANSDCPGGPGTGTRSVIGVSATATTNSADVVSARTPSKGQS